MSVSAKQVVEMLRKRYSEEREWVTAEEVGNRTGYGQSRRCDFMAMNLYPSKGLALHGHEIKVARSDWLNEIQDPSKAGAFTKYCHYWWIVAPKGVVKLEELPADWGYMEVGKTARVRKAGTEHKDPELDREFVAAFLRGACNGKVTNRLKQEAYSRGFQNGKETKVDDRRVNNLEYINKRLTAELEEYQRQPVGIIKEVLGMPWGIERTIKSLTEIKDQIDEANRLLKGNSDA